MSLYIESGFRAVVHDDPQEQQQQQHHHHHHQSTSLIHPCIPYISANNRDIDTKLTGYVPWGPSRLGLLNYLKGPPCSFQYC